MDQTNDSYGSVSVSANEDSDEKDSDEKNIEQTETGTLALLVDNEEANNYLSRWKQVFLSYLPLGFVAFGGPAAYAILHERFVESKQWLDEDLFLEFLALCQALPGPSATQLVVAIAFNHGGYIGGIIAFFLWNLPCFIISTLVGLGINQLHLTNTPDWMSGLAPSAISLVFIASFKLGNKCIFKNKKINFNEKGKHFNILLLISLLSAIIILFVTSINEQIISNQAKGFVYPFVIFGGGLCTLFDSLLPFRKKLYQTFKENDTTIATDDVEKNKNKIIYVKCMLLIAVWLITLFVFILLRYETNKLKDSIWILFESLWRTGSIVYGGGQVILPMLFGEVVDTRWLSEEEFWTGYALAQILPGPLSCKIAAYIGALMYGVFGSLFAWFSLFAPGMLLIFAFLPIMKTFKKWIWFQIMMEGINCAAIGLLVSACIKLWSSAVNTVADSCVVLITGSLVAFWKIPTPIAIIIGGFAGFIFSDTVLSIGQKLL